MSFFEKNTGKKIKTLSIAFFVLMLLYFIIFAYQGLRTIMEINMLTEQGYTVTDANLYIDSIIMGLIPRLAVVLAAFPIYGFGKMVENSDRLTEHYLKNEDESLDKAEEESSEEMPAENAQEPIEEIKEETEEEMIE